MALRDWLDNGWLISHATSSEEVSNLLAIVDRDLSDCRTKGLSPDWRLNIAYNAALQAATAALGGGWVQGFPGLASLPCHSVAGADHWGGRGSRSPVR